MPVENDSGYLNSIDPNYPKGGEENVDVLDNYMRVRWKILQNTLPNISDVVTPTHTELNYVDGVTSAIQTQLDQKLASSSYTAADVLTKIKTVDGAGSGLDADTLDGTELSALATLDSPAFTTTATLDGSELLVATQGTFTPVIADDPTAGNTGSASYTYGWYQTVGKVTTFMLTLNTINTSGMTSGNTLYIRDLPATQRTNTSAPCACWIRNIDYSDKNSFVAQVSANTSVLTIKKFVDNVSTDATVNVGELSAADSDIRISGMIFAA